MGEKIKEIRAAIEELLPQNEKLSTEEIVVLYNLAILKNYKNRILGIIEVADSMLSKGRLADSDAVQELAGKYELGRKQHELVQ